MTTRSLTLFFESWAFVRLLDSTKCAS